MPSLREILAIQKNQISRYNVLRKEILHKLTQKVIHLSSHGELKCIYTVPRYMFGFPRYNVEEITAYLFTYIKNEGFCVVLLDDDKIFISWDINDINNNLNRNKKPKKKVVINDLKPLINIKRI